MNNANKTYTIMSYIDGHTMTAQVIIPTQTTQITLSNAGSPMATIASMSPSSTPTLTHKVDGKYLAHRVCITSRQI